MESGEMEKEITDREEEDASWKREHDTYLKKIVATYGNSDWRIISDCMNNKFKEVKRTEKECKYRWKYHLEPAGGKQSWGDKERYMLLVAHRKYKNHWSEVARMLRKTTSNAIKNRFYTLFRKVRNRIKNDSCATSSPLDLLEIYYVLSLVEQYQSLPPDKSSAPDKNYAHKLAQQMEKGKVAEYKAKVMELHKGEGSMAELFDKYAAVYGVQQRKETDEELKAKDQCKGLDLAGTGEETLKPKITLPEPSTYHSSEVMTDEEKDAFRRSAFPSARPGSRGASSTVSLRPMSRSQPCSANSMDMRDDEYSGFSQLVTPFEEETKKPPPSSLAHLPSSFQSWRSAGSPLGTPPFNQLSPAYSSLPSAAIGPLDSSLHPLTNQFGHESISEAPFVPTTTTTFAQQPMNTGTEQGFQANSFTFPAGSPNINIFCPPPSEGQGQNGLFPWRSLANGN